MYALLEYAVFVGMCMSKLDTYTFKLVLHLGLHAAKFGD